MAAKVFLIQYFFYSFLLKNCFERIKNKLLVPCWTLNAMEKLSLSAFIRAQNILLFSDFLSKHLKNTCEKGCFLVKLQGGGSFRYTLIFLNLSAKNSAKQFSCRKCKYFWWLLLTMKSSYSMSRQIMSDCLMPAFSYEFILNIGKIKD